MRRSPFFDGVAQADITVAGRPGKMPIFYYDGFGATTVFPARLSALRRLIPDPDLVPARFLPGMGLIALSAFEYRDCDVGEYNEVAISVILKDPGARSNAPGQAVGRALRRKQFHVYVHHLPVTTQAALEGGRDFYNFPKFIASIEFKRGQAGGGRRPTLAHAGGRGGGEPPDIPGDGLAAWSCRLAEGEEHILTLHANDLTGERDTELQVFSHLWMDRRPQSTEFKFHATPLAMTTRPGSAHLELGGRHPIAVELRELLLSRRSLHHQQMDCFEGILYGPDKLSFALLERASAALGAQAGAPA